ncbi:hypothetical protein [Oleidesulfovibrio sp.]|uniref:hypothetical protein n=1 Tax=Oleidesulfovibrio sp. TaxID=2909707 RepID=UPI003A88335F
MSAWQGTAFTPSSTAATIRTGLDGVLSGIGADVAATQARLAAVTGGALPQASPLASAAGGAVALRSRLDALVASGGRFVCVHPYVHPVGDRRGDYSYLTPAECITALADKLTDVEEPLVSSDTPEADSLAAVVLLFHAPDHAAFARLLQAFNAVFPVTSLQLAQRRSAQLDALESDKFITTTAPREPRWIAAPPHRHGTVRRMETTLGPLLAQAESYNAENTTPEAELHALLAARAEHVARQDAAWAKLCSQLAGGSGLARYLTGDAENMARQLKTGGAPAAAFKLCAAVCWVGAAPRVAAFKEVFGL